MPDKCRCTVLFTKIEIHLAKDEQIHWTSLEFNKESALARRVIGPSGNVDDLITTNFMNFFNYLVLEVLLILDKWQGPNVMLKQLEFGSFGG